MLTELNGFKLQQEIDWNNVEIDNDTDIRWFDKSDTTLIALVIKWIETFSERK